MIKYYYNYCCCTVDLKGNVKIDEETKNIKNLRLTAQSKMKIQKYLKYRYKTKILKYLKILA